MVKKRQTDAHDPASSTDSGEEELQQHRSGALAAGQALDGATPTAACCQHIKKAVDATRLRRQLKVTGLLYECSQCQKLGQAKAGAEAGSPAAAANSAGGGEPGDYEFDSTLWLCLKCGSQLCGRARKKHALEHYQVGLLPHRSLLRPSSLSLTFPRRKFVDVTPLISNRILCCLHRHLTRTRTRWP